MEYVKDHNGKIEQVIFNYEELEEMSIQELLHEKLDLPDSQKQLLEKREQEALKDPSLKTPWKTIMNNIKL